MQATEIQRLIYRPSGRVNWGTFLPLAGLALLVAAGAAAGLNWLYESGHYIVILAPAIASLAVAALVGAAVYLGRCRSPAVGGALGLLAAAVLYLGMYVVGLARAVGWEQAWRPELVKEYIAWRLRSDVQEDVGHGRHDRTDRPSRAMNVFTLVMESGIVLLMTGSAGLQRSRRAYCERCGRWKAREVVFYPAGTGAAWREAAEAGDVGAVVRQTKPVLVGAQQRRYAAVAVEYCPDHAGAECPVYLGVKEVKAGGGATRFQQYDAAWGKRLVRQAELSEAEVAAVGTVVPSLKARSSSVPLAATAVAGTPDELTRNAPTAAAAGAVARIEPVRGPHVGHALTRGAILLGNALAIACLVAFFGAIGLAAWGASRLQSAPPAGVAMLATAVLVGAVAGFMGIRNPSLLGNRYLLARTRGELSQRPDRIVKEREADAEFVEVVPRANWGKMMLETATDIGLLRLDTQRREIRFEGDRERWRIPAGAVLNCAAEPAMPPGSAILYYMLVLGVRTAEGPRELSLAVRATRLFPSGNAWRQAWAEQTAARVRQMTGGGAGVPAPPPGWSTSIRI